MQILVWENKYSTSYYDASTPEALEAAALNVLGELLDMGYIFAPEDPMKYIQYAGIDIEQAALTDEQIEALPTTALRNTAAKHKRALARRKSMYEEDVKDYAEIKRVLNGEEVLVTYNRSGDTRPLTAWRVLQDRNGGEYEQFELETVWSAK